MKQSDVDTKQSLEALHEILEAGDKVYTLLRHVSRSGMMRHISLFVCTQDGLQDITWHVARALQMKRADNGGIKISGCGMDMGFELVYQLGHAMWPNGTPKPHGNRNGQPDSAGGYALNHYWM